VHNNENHSDGHYSEQSNVECQASVRSKEGRNLSSSGGWRRQDPIPFESYSTITEGKQFSRRDDIGNVRHQRSRSLSPPYERRAREQGRHQVLDHKNYRREISRIYPSKCLVNSEDFVPDIFFIRFVNIY
jgi:hypothetical protein